MNCNVEFYGAASNLTKNCLDWNAENELICYASSNRLLLYDIKNGSVVGTNEAHISGYITCVKWVKKEGINNDQFYIVCCTSDGSVWLFRLNLDNRNNYVQHLLYFCYQFKGLEGSANSCDGLLLCKENEIFVIATGMNSTLRGWKYGTDTNDIQDLFCYKFDSRSLALEVQFLSAFMNVKQSWPLIVYGGDDGKIHILASSDGYSYNSVGQLCGHEDWILSLDHYVEENGDVILASGSKDGLIRIWRLTLQERRKIKNELEMQVLKLKIPEKKLKVDEESYFSMGCSLESILQGHDGFITHLNWGKFTYGNSFSRHLLSCSKTEDRSVIVWELKDFGEGDCLWSEKTRLGEVGGNREGFFTSKFCGDAVIASNYQGGLHMWNIDGTNWLPHPLLTGHFNEVVDIDWDIEGRYLLSTSKDQTTRVFACHILEEKNCWKEISRPQVHGYDMVCICHLNKHTFISGAEEKVIRGFSATTQFVRTFGSISGHTIKDDLKECNFPEKASVPSLGLSNESILKPISNEISSESSKAESTIKLSSKGGPTEDELLLGTLWPEISKLYGHGNEILALTTSPDGNLLASSCRATNELDAKIIIWDTKEWKQIGYLSPHRLSVTQMEFSSDNKLLLSVSRDRSWAVSCIDPLLNFPTHFHSNQLPRSQQHSRIIWSCAWLSGGDRFVTGSRDKTVCIWKRSSDCIWEREARITEDDEVTAIGITSFGRTNEVLLAVGTVTGKVVLRIYDTIKESFADALHVEPCHRKTVRRLRFQPRTNNSKELVLASCANDHAVIIYRINI